MKAIALDRTGSSKQSLIPSSPRGKELCGGLRQNRLRRGMRGKTLLCSNPPQASAERGRGSSLERSLPAPRQHL